LIARGNASIESAVDANPPNRQRTIVQGSPLSRRTASSTPALTTSLTRRVTEPGDLLADEGQPSRCDGTGSVERAIKYALVSPASRSLIGPVQDRV